MSLGADGRTITTVDSAEYRAIAQHYGQQTARRSGVPLIRHIDEGLLVLEAIGAERLESRAYCLHPLVQGDDDLRANFGALASFDADVVALAMEYRWIANGYLSPHPSRPPSEITLSPLAAVNRMLVADKVQNYKDFLRYHRDSHPRADRLDEYFRQWLQRLEITPERFEELRRLLD